MTLEDNCVSTKKNVTVALEWTSDEGVSWHRLATMHNRQHAQMFNVTLPAEAMMDGDKGGVRFRWTQIEHATTDIYWALDNIRLD